MSSIWDARVWCGSRHGRQATGTEKEGENAALVKEAARLRRPHKHFLSFGAAFQASDPVEKGTK